MANSEGKRYEILSNDGKTVEIRFSDTGEIISYKVIDLEDIKARIREGKEINLDECYIKDFSYRKLSVGSGKPLMNFHARYSFWDGNVDFSDAQFGVGNVYFRFAQFGDGNVSFSNAQFGDGDVDFSGAQFGDGDVDFSEAQFGNGNVSFSGAQFGVGNVDFSSALFGDGDVDFSGAQFGVGDVDFSGAQFGVGKVDFSEAQFGVGNVSFILAQFGDGDVYFRFAQFGDGYVDFSHAQFGDGDVYFRFAQFGDGDVYFSEAQFGDGNVSFSGAQFGDGNVDFSSALFGDGKVYFSSAQFGDGDVYFSEAQFGDGNVSFSGAQFGDGYVDFIGAQFGDGDVDFSEAQFGDGYVDFRDAQFGDGDVDFSEAQFGDGYVDFRDAQFGDGRYDFTNIAAKNTSIYFSNQIFNSHITLSFKELKKLVFSDCTNHNVIEIQEAFYKQEDEKPENAIHELAFLNVCNLGTIRFNWDEYKKALRDYSDEAFIGDFEKAKTDEFKMLKENYHNQGEYDWEDAAYVEFKQRYAAGLKWTKHPFKKLMLKLLHLVGKFGTSYLSIAVTMLVVVLLWGFFYHLCGDNIYPTEENHHWWSPLYYSVITFFTVGYGDLSAQDGCTAFLCGAESFFGVFLMSYFSVAVVRKILR